MASAIIHLAIAKELEKYLNIESKYNYYLGSIAPDISKQIGRVKKESHFLYNTEENVPNIKMFTKKYRYFFKNEFDLGYFIHLYTDKIWFEEFISKKTYRDSIKLLDGTIINANEDEIINLIYQDYTNLNIQIIDDYNLDLSLFYEDFYKPHTCIDEIPIDKLNILIDKMSIIIENSKNNKNYIFNLAEIDNFISNSVERINKELKNYIPD